MKLDWSKFYWRVRWFEMDPSTLSVLLGRLLGVTITDTGTASQSVALPVAGVLAVMTTAFSARVNPDRLASWNHLASGRVHVTVGTLPALWAACSWCIDGVHAGRRGAVCHQAPGNAIQLTGALLTL